MQVKVTIEPPHRQNILASVSLELVAEDGTHVFVHDCRVLKNKGGVLWFSMPTHSVQIGGGRQAYEYKPTIEVNNALHRRISDTVLAAFEAWQAGGSQ